MIAKKNIDLRNISSQLNDIQNDIAQLVIHIEGDSRLMFYRWAADINDIAKQSAKYVKDNFNPTIEV